MTTKKIIIAIDGYSSCGKSTLAKQLAQELGFVFIDSGAMYRAITLHFIRHNVPLDNKDAVVEALNTIHLSFHPNPQTGISDMYLNDENVSHLIREMTIAEKVSDVAAIKEVRRFAVAQQQLMGKKKGLVMDGRDIGTVVFPDAELKIFMTALPEVRVKRRFQELYASNPNITIEEVKTNLELRDYIDTNREEGPLRMAEGAYILDNSNLDRDEQLQTVLKWVKELAVAY